MLIKSPAFTAMAVVSIALGIGANTTVFSVINAVLLKSLPYKDPDSLVLVWGDSETSSSLKGRNQVSATDVADYRAQSTSFEDVATYTGWYPIMSGDGLRDPGRKNSGYPGRRRVFQSDESEAMLGRESSSPEEQDGRDRTM